MGKIEGQHADLDLTAKVPSLYRLLNQNFAANLVYCAMRQNISIHCLDSSVFLSDIWCYFCFQ